MAEDHAVTLQQTAEELTIKLSVPALQELKESQELEEPAEHLQGKVWLEQDLDVQLVVLDPLVGHCVIQTLAVKMPNAILDLTDLAKPGQFVLAHEAILATL